MEKTQRKKILKTTSSVLVERLKKRRDRDYFSEKGIADFAQFAWDSGKDITKMRKSLGWDSSYINELATLLRESLGDRCMIYASDLYKLSNYYIGCERLSKILWKPLETSESLEET